MPTREKIVDRYILWIFWVLVMLDIVYIVTTEAISRTEPGIGSVGIYPIISYLCPPLLGYWPGIAFCCFYILFIAPFTMIMTWRIRDNYGYIISFLFFFGSSLSSLPKPYSYFSRIRTDVTISILIGTPAFIMYIIFSIFRPPPIFFFFFFSCSLISNLFLFFIRFFLWGFVPEYWRYYFDNFRYESVYSLFTHSILPN